MLHISNGNNKIGKIANISLMPVLTCLRACAHCYAMRHFIVQKEVRKAWAANTWIYKRMPNQYFEWLQYWIIQNIMRKPGTKKYFRWHVGGDIPHIRYLYGMIETANKIKKCRFLCYTQRIDILNYIDKKDIPKNLIIYISSRNDEKNTLGYLNAFVASKDKRIHQCKGKCDECYYCFHGKGDVNLKYLAYTVPEKWNMARMTEEYNKTDNFFKTYTQLYNKREV